MNKTFSQTFIECNKTYGNNSHMKSETDRIHQKTVRDGNHAFYNVNIIRPDPWQNKTGFTF